MELTKEIKDTLETLSKVNLDFFEFVEKNPACLKRANFKELEELRNKLQLLQPWPTFLSRKRKEMFQDAGVKLCNLIKSIPKRLFNNDTERMSTFYELPVNIINLQMEGVAEEHLENLLARGDFIFSPAKSQSQSELKCVEYNIAGNLGGHLLPFWESLYLKNPLIRKFLSEYRVKVKNKNLLEIYLEHCIQSVENLVLQTGDTEMNVTLVFKNAAANDSSSMAGYLDKLYKELLKRKHPSLTGNVFLCDYSDLEVENDWVYYRGRKIHAITEWYFGLVPPRIMKVFKTGNIRILNGPITNLLSSKLNLVLLSENENSPIFNDEEKETIKKYVPWSRKIAPGETTYKDKKIQLVDFIISNKDTMVIKPSLGLGGDGVYIGQHMPEKEWERLVKTAIQKKDCLAQELVESGSALYQYGEAGCDKYDLAWGFFIFGSQYAGTFLRVISKKNMPRIINTHQGAQISIVFDVDE